MPGKMGKKSDDEKKKFKENARKVTGPTPPRPVAGNKEGRASEFYKGSRPMNFLIDTLLPGKPGKVKMPAPGRRTIRSQKKPVPPKARGGR
jgi:hypothetical protein